MNKLAGAMRPDLFRRLPDEVPRQRLTLQGLGEPLLSPYLIDSVAGPVRACRASPCGMVMGDDRVSLGDLTGSGFREIGYGLAYRDFRRRLHSAEPPDGGRGCSLYRHTF